MNGQIFFNIVLPTLVVGIVGNVLCSLVGCYLVLRRLSLVGDAISHAVLPGIALAFLLTGQVSGPAMLVGALLFGLVTTFLTDTVNQFTNTPEDASLGVVFSSLFAFGVILIQVATHDKAVDLDPGCVLYGALDHVAGSYIEFIGWRIPRALLTLLPLLVFVLAFITLFWKELLLVSFDPAHANAMGFPVWLIHYLLMGGVACVTVACFESLGSVLVVAFLIVPAAAAQLLARRLFGMMLWSTCISIISAILGFVLAESLQTQVAAMMTVVVGACFLLAVIFAPGEGLLSKIMRNGQLTLQIAGEDVLGILYRKEETGQPGMTVPRGEACAGVQGWPRWLVIPWLRWRGWVSQRPAGVGLTASGRHLAEQLVRAHRLWEAYLQEEMALAPDHLHDPAHIMEHFIGPALQRELVTELGGRGKDPHGRNIPTQKQPGSE